MLITWSDGGHTVYGPYGTDEAEAVRKSLDARCAEHAVVRSVPMLTDPAALRI